MVLQHFVQLAHYHWKLLLGIIVCSGGLAWLLSMLLLFASPLYTGSTKVLMMPNQSELEFTRGWVADSQFSAIQIMPQTHMEYLMSRPVLELTIDKILEAFPKQEGSAETSLLKQVFTKAKATFWRTYNTLNYGYHVPLTPRQEIYADLLEGIEIEIVEASYILLLEVTLKDPVAAAIAANALAEAYVEHAAQQSEFKADQLQAYLNETISEKEVEIDKLSSREHEVRGVLGMSSAADQRELLKDLLRDEQQQLFSDQIEAKELSVRLDVLRGMKGTMRSPETVNKVEEEITMGNARWKALTQSEALREQQIADIKKDMHDLSAIEGGLQAIKRSMGQFELEVATLKKRIGALDLAKSKVMGQVRVIEKAKEPLYPKFPKVFLNAIVGVIAGILSAMFILVVIDTSSARIKTTVDLRRLVGERCIGWISKRVLRKQSDLHSFQVRRFGENIERQLALFNGFNDNKSIYVSGFGSDDFIDQSVRAIRRALASRGLNSKIVSAERSDGPSIEGDAAEYQLLDLGAISSQLDLQEVAVKSKTLICVLRAGEVFEDTLLAFKNNALESGFDALTFVLVSE